MNAFHKVVTKLNDILIDQRCEVCDSMIYLLKLECIIFQSISNLGQHNADVIYFALQKSQNYV